MYSICYNGVFFPVRFFFFFAYFFYCYFFFLITPRFRLMRMLESTSSEFELGHQLLGKLVHPLLFFCFPLDSPRCLFSACVPAFSLERASMKRFVKGRVGEVKAFASNNVPVFLITSMNKLFIFFASGQRDQTPFTTSRNDNEAKKPREKSSHRVTPIVPHRQEIENGTSYYCTSKSKFRNTSRKTNIKLL